MKKRNGYFKINKDYAWLTIIRKNDERLWYLIDTKNIPVLRLFHFFADAKGYARSVVKGQVLGLPEILLGKREPGHVYDHKTGDVYDNRVENLRYCSWRTNLNNKNRRCKTKTGIYGISVAPGGYRVRTAIGIHKHTKNLMDALFYRLDFLQSRGIPVSEGLKQSGIISRKEYNEKHGIEQKHRKK